MTKRPWEWRIMYSILFKTFFLFTLMISVAFGAGSSPAFGPLIPGYDSCSMEEGDSDFYNLLHEATPMRCWDRKQSYDRMPKHLVDNKALLESDYDICECLRSPEKNKNVDIRKLMNFSTVKLPNYNPPESALAAFKLNAQKLRDELERDRNSLAFQASLVSKNDPIFTDVYATDPTSRVLSSTQKRMLPFMNHKSFVNELTVLKHIKGQGPLSRLNAPKEAFSKSQQSHEAKEVREIIKTFDVPPKTNPAYFQEAAMSDGQCIGGREFVAYKSLPGNEVIREISDVDSFDPDSWNYDLLYAQYKTFMKMPAIEKDGNKEEINKLKSKLGFLKRNPMIKTFFNSKSDFDSEAFSGIEESRKVFIKATIDKNKDTLNTRKKELFAVLKKSLSVDKSCTLEPKHCLRNKISEGLFDNYHEGLKNFFINPDVADMMGVETEREVFGKLKSLENPQMLSSQNEVLTQEAVVANFMVTTGLNSPDRCTAAELDLNVQDCVEIYAAYCKTLDQVIPKLNKPNMSMEIQDDLDTLASFDSEPEMDKNPELAKTNNDYCNVFFVSKSNPKEQETFFTFKNKYCKRSKAPECQGPDSFDKTVKIRSKFFEQFEKKSTEVAGGGEELLTFLKASPVRDMVSIPTGNTSMSGGEAFAALRNPSSSKLTQDQQESSLFSGLSRGLENVAQNMANNDGGDSSFVDYSATSGASFNKKIENLSENEKQDLLNDWQKDLASLKKENEKTQSADPASKMKEDAMKERISALEALLDQQKKLTEKQYKLLNDALDSQKQSTSNVAQTNSEVDGAKKKKSKKTKKSSSVANASDGFIPDATLRTPASIKDGSFDNNDASSAPAARASGPLTTSMTSNKDSIAREEAKLINLRQNENGSITIQQVGNGSAAIPNAINVVITEEMYRMAQLNPTDLNLTQIEKSISKEQIRQLGNREVIVLLLQNGSNPPLEVKVRKQNNKLVQVENGQIISRKISLESLQNTLKN